MGQPIELRMALCIDTRAHAKMDFDCEACERHHTCYNSCPVMFIMVTIVVVMFMTIIMFNPCDCFFASRERYHSSGGATI